MDGNLARINYEVLNEIQWSSTSQYNYSFQDFKTSTDTPYNLALAFLANYEKPKDPNQPIRGTQAEYWYEYLGGIPPTPTGETKRKGFNWVVFLRNIRRNRNLTI